MAFKGLKYARDIGLGKVINTNLNSFIPKAIGYFTNIPDKVSN
ncbi:hypothetical protein BMWSH_3676 [Priestia megaterium WSH-002]|uniref:Uncharacterized protein n=1 Tax=Priestia megaterium (strain WSH-002) TaxID=1006007 RepID=A0A8D4BPM2_PRIMW|nr:hypothetical protein BMWSH_3676 [Priestia megaterium WSH-002]